MSILPSNCYSSRSFKSINGVVVHYISAVNVLPSDPFNFDAIIGIFKRYKVSAHYLINRKGKVVELIPLNKVAYHAGKSRMNGVNRCNNWAIGIELMGGRNFEYTADQISAVTVLLARLISEHKIPLENIQGHDEVRREWNINCPKKKGSKKYDPGEQFPWDDVLNSLNFIG